MKSLRTPLIIALGALILLLVGLYNGYPLVYSDTGTYILSGFSKIIPRDRPIAYGLFIKLFSLNYSLWFVIAIQNLLTAFIVYQALKCLNINHKRFNLVYLSSLLFLVLFTGIGWYTNQMIPDFFTPIAVLTIFILLMRKSISWFMSISLGAILIFSIITHFSHLLICSALIIVVLLLKYSTKRSFNLIPFRKIWSIGLIVFSCWIILPGVNYLVGKEFILSKGSHMFVMAHLVDTGILAEFLDEHCAEVKYSDCKLCDIKDSLPVDLAAFLWSSEIREKIGGWTGSKEEFTMIIKGTLKQPKYLFMNIYKSFTYGMIQLTRNEIGSGLSSYKSGSAPYAQITFRFPHERNNYINSRQNKYEGMNLNLKALNIVYLFVLFALLLVTFSLFFGSRYDKLDPETKIFLLFVLIAIIINSFATAGLNVPYGRLQTRVVWMFPLALIALISKNYYPLRNWPQ